MTARVAQITRNPLKGHGRQTLREVVLTAGAALPHDRRWAVAHEAARLDPAGGWSPWQNFLQGSKIADLMALDAEFDESSASLTLSHPRLGTHSFQPDDPADQAEALAWLAPLYPANRAQPAAIVSARVAFTDTEYPSVSLLSLASLRDLSARIGQELSAHRFRCNFWIEGLEPWAEFDLVGQEVRLGGARLLVSDRIVRCRATMANPETGQIDAPVLDTLSTCWGHRDFGLYAKVIEGGHVCVGDAFDPATTPA